MGIDDKEMKADNTIERHNLRKQLKLLMLSNMKMKKQVKACARGRVLNRLRLEEEVSSLNNIAHSLVKHVLGTQKADNISIANFTNPVQLADDESNCSASAAKKSSDEYKFYCDRCSFKCRKKTPFTIHMRRHEKSKPYLCKECPQTFVSPAELKTHQQKHWKGKRYSCDQCSYVTYNAYVLVSHKERIHLTCHTYSCSSCSYTTQNRSKWSDHKSTHPTHNTDVQCMACKISRKRLKSDIQLVNTRKQSESNGDDNVVHTCDKRWSCQYCGLLFKRCDSLKKHTAKHTLDKKYSCDLCDYSAVTKHSLTIHTRKHSGDKPYQCSECPFSCSTRSYLTVHTNIHLGVKPYGCDICSFRSADSSKISSHKKRMHDNLEHNETLGAKLKDSKKGSPHRTTKMMCKYCGRMFPTVGALLHHEKEHIIED